MIPSDQPEPQKRCSDNQPLSDQSLSDQPLDHENGLSAERHDPVWALLAHSPRPEVHASFTQEVLSKVDQHSAAHRRPSRALRPFAFAAPAAAAACIAIAFFTLSGNREKIALEKTAQTEEATEIFSASMTTDGIAGIEGDLKDLEHLTDSEDLESALAGDLAALAEIDTVLALQDVAVLDDAEISQLLF